jgi:hypothetical protein
VNLRRMFLTNNGRNPNADMNIEQPYVLEEK